MAAASSLWQVQAATVSQCWFRSCPQHSMDQPTCSLGQGSHGQLAARPGTCTADGALTSLLDVVHIPTIGVLVFQHLDHEGRKQARLASRDLCMLVDTNISSLHLELPDTSEEEHHMGLRLKQRKLQPKDLRIIGRKSKNSSRGDALAAAGLDFFMQRVEKVRLDDTAFPAGIAKVLACSKHGLYALSSVPSTGDGWQILGQFTALQCLTIQGADHICNFANSQWQAFSSLCCLTILSLRVQLLDFSPLKQLTQLKHLWLLLPESTPVQHPEALTHLTALESLDLREESVSGDFSMHDSLAHLVVALSSLRKLTLPDVPPGPWTEALARLTGLSQLRLQRLGRDNAPHPIHLPSVRVLTAHSVTARQLALITAPSLTRLLGFADPDHILPHMLLVCKKGQPNSVRVSASGLMRHCNRVAVSRLDLTGPFWPQAESHATLAALCQSWRPTASVMGSDPATRVWDLYIQAMRFGQAEAALVPAGITHLTLGACNLASGSLAPLAQLVSLRDLSLIYCLCKVELLEQLLSSAVQGRGLRIRIILKEQATTIPAVSAGALASGPTEQDYRDTHSRVVAARGEESTPRLTITSPLRYSLGMDR